MGSPILVYQDTNKLYTFFTDASNYVWSAVLTQEYIIPLLAKMYDINVQLLMSLDFPRQSIQLDCIEKKEAYAIHLSVN